MKLGDVLVRSGFNYRRYKVGFASVGFGGSFRGQGIELSFDLIGDVALLVSVQNIVAPARFSHRQMVHHPGLVLTFNRY